MSGDLLDVLLDSQAQGGENPNHGLKGFAFLGQCLTFLPAQHEVMDLAVAGRVKEALKDLPEGERSAIVMASIILGVRTPRPAGE